MKNTKTNGAASPAAKTASKKTAEHIFTESVLEAEDREHRVRLKAMEDKRVGARKKITIEIAADTFGFLCAAGVVHDATPEEVAAAFLNGGVTDWSNDDYYLEDVEI